jgi:hypothetical protein
LNRLADATNRRQSHFNNALARVWNFPVWGGNSSTGPSALCGHFGRLDNIQRGLKESFWYSIGDDERAVHGGRAVD